MSVNYHAFTSRGLPLTHYEAICEGWFRDFTGYDPALASKVLKLKYDENYAYMQYWGRDYRLVLKNGHMEKRIGDAWSEDVFFNEAMVIYHLLLFTKPDAVVRGIWVPCDSVDGLVSRGRMPDPLLAPFGKLCTGRCEELKEACLAFGGVPVNKGDVGFEFAATEQIHLQLIFYDADEDFEAQAQVMVDRNVTDFIHYETVGCVISDLLEMLEERLKV